jgi:capsular exopolysaccharide synthesis family protein
MLDLLEESLKTEGEQPQLLPANIGVSSANVSGPVSEYNNLVLEYQKYGVSAGQNNPQLMSLKEQLTELKANIFESIATYRLQLKATKSRIEEKNQVLANKVYSIPAKEKVFLDIKRQQEIKQSLYIFLLERREEAAISYAITEPSVKVVEQALSAGGPISPNSRSIYMRAILGGLAIPFACIYLFFLLDTKLKNRSDIEKITTKIPVVAELPKFKKEEQLSFINPNDTSKQAEAFRILSYNLNYVLPPSDEDKGKVIYCTSTIKGEGKTYVSMNLSLAFSSLNKKVLIIGADLRNPQIHTYLGRPKENAGLSNYLYDVDFDWKSGLIKGFDQHPHHDILLSGSIPPNPTSLLTNGRLNKLFQEAKSEYDYIIVDTAPTILVSDTMLISSLADATIYITRANYTEKKLLQYSKGLSETGKVKNMAYVINALEDKKANGYGYNYGYNYGYGSDS